MASKIKRFLSMALTVFMIMTMMPATVLATEEASPEVNIHSCVDYTEVIVDAVAATCTATGLTEGKKCSVCGEILVAQEEVPAAHTEDIIDAVAATCTETGLTEGKKCTVCGEVTVEQEVVPASHNYVDGVCACGDVEVKGPLMKAIPMNTGDEGEGTEPVPPKATVSRKSAKTLAAGDYMCWPSGSTSVSRPLQIVLNFKAEDSLEQALAGGYSKYLVDFYLTLSGLAGESIEADGCYLAGYYGDFGWIVIPADDMVIESGVTYPIVSAYDATLNYKDICESVKDFTAAIYIAPEIVQANPDIKVALSLRMTDPDDSENVLKIGETYVYDADDLLPDAVDVEAEQPEGVDDDTHDDIVSDMKNNASVLSQNRNAVSGIDGVFELKVEFVSYTAENNVPTELVFDVEPVDANGDEVELSSAITFRLPVPSAVIATKAEVFHNGGSIGLHEIKGSGNNRYVEISAEDFCPFSLKLASPVAKIGTTPYETLEAAYAAAQSDDTIVLLKDVTLTSVLTIGKDVTIDGNGYSIIADHSDYILTTSSDCAIKNITLNTNSVSKGVRIGQKSPKIENNVGFSNVTISNSNKTDAITVYGHLTVESRLNVNAGTYSVFGAGSKITVEEGTVFILSKSVGSVSPATSDLKGAVEADVDGKATSIPYFAAHSATAYYVNLEKMDGLNIMVPSQLTLLKDATISNASGRDISVSGTKTFNLNGHTLTIANGKKMNVSGNLTVTGTGSIVGDIVLTAANATVTGSADLNVISGLNGYLCVYEEGTHKLVKDEGYVAMITTAEDENTLHKTLADAVAAAKMGETITLLADVALTSALNIDKALALEMNGKTITGTIVLTNTSVSLTVDAPLNDVTTNVTGYKVDYVNGIYYKVVEDPITVSFNANGGEGRMADQRFLKGVAKKLNPNTFTRKNFYFTGWNTKADGSGDHYANKAEIAFTANTTLYAQWKRVINTTTYTVQYNANGGSGSVYLQVFTENMTFNLRMNEFVREGYKFVGWNTKADGTGESYAEGAKYSGKQSITLYAQWKLDVPEFPAVRPEYKIEVDGQQGTITRKNDTSIVFDKMYIRWSIGFDTVDGPFAMIAILDVVWNETQEGIVGTFTIPVVQTNGTISGVNYMLTTNPNANMIGVGEAAKDMYGMLIK